MILSERGAIGSAIADGGFHLFPAGKLIDIIKAELQGDKLDGDFNSQTTVEKIRRVQGPQEPKAKELFDRDRETLCTRLSVMNPNYDIEAIFDKMMSAVPAMAKRYYGIENFEAPRPVVVEYYFEGHNDMYKDGDWFAFNVNRAESKELNVPVGTYFKRNQVSPGLPEFVTLHEANHAMQDVAASPEGFHHYVPWFDEGLADTLGRMMLFKATGDEALLSKVKNSRTELEVTDPRKVTYHFGAETAALLIMRGRLPFLKALMRVRKKEPFNIDWNAFAAKIKSGWDPHIALVTAYTGEKPDTFRKHVERDETAFRKDADLDQMDLRILGMFLATQAPACLSPSEYLAALWLSEEITKRPSPHAIDPDVIPTALRAQVPGWSETSIIPASEIPESIWKKSPGIDLKIVIREEAIPESIKDGVNALAAKYFIVKRSIGQATVFEPYGGGLPYRLGTGEIRCTY